MESAWRVACVRIPRFPIGAVWRQAGEAGAAGRSAPADEQLGLGLETATEASRVARRASRGTDRSSRQPSGDGSAASRGDLEIGGGSPGARPGSAPPDAPSDAPLDAPADARRATPDAPPHWDDLPLALADGPRLRAVTAAAARLRVRAGMSVAEARGRCAALELLAWSEPAVAGELVRATAAFLVASPQVTPVAGAPGLWWIGAGGLAAVGGERGLVRTLLRVARRWHPRARVAVADSCVAARAATWADHDGAAAFVVPPGGCAAYLAPAPLALVPMEDELRQTLQALGLRTAGALAALAAPDVERRWGAVGLQAWRLARGDDRRRPVLARPEAARAVSAELAAPAATMEPILFLVRAALDRLVAGLVAEGRAAAVVAVTLTLDDGRGALPAGGVAHTVTREIRLPRPLARVAPLFERCRALLDRWPLQAPVGGVLVAIVATAPAAGQQGELLAAGWRDPGAAEAALERLRAELGPQVVVRPVACDAHAPERRGAWVEEEDGGVAEEGARRGGGPAGGGGEASRVARRASGGTDRAAGTDGAAVRPSGDGAEADPGDLEIGGGTPGARPGPAPRVARRATRLTLLRDPAGPANDAGDEPDVPPDLPDLALRLLEAPEVVDVEWRDGTPRTVWWRGRGVPVVEAAGPERLAGDWWSAPYHRDYWRCLAAEGEFLIYRDHLPPAEAGARWYLQGWYD